MQTVFFFKIVETISFKWTNQHWSCHLNNCAIVFFYDLIFFKNINRDEFHSNVFELYRLCEFFIFLDVIRFKYCGGVDPLRGRKKGRDGMGEGSWSYRSFDSFLLFLHRQLPIWWFCLPFWCLKWWMMIYIEVEVLSLTLCFMKKLSLKLYEFDLWRHSANSPYMAFPIKTHLYWSICMFIPFLPSFY